MNPGTQQSLDSVKPRFGDDLVPALGFLGIGCYWAWVYLSFSSTVLFPYSRQTGTLVRTTLVMSLCAFLATVLATTLAADRLPRLLERRLTLIAPVVASAGTAVTAFAGGLSPVSLVGLLLGSVMTGTGTGWLLLMWGKLYGSADARRTAIRVAAALIVSILVYFAIVGAQRSIAIAAVSVLPLLSLAMLLLAQRSQAVVPPVTARHERLRYPWRLAMALCASGMAAGFIMGTLLDSPDTINAAGTLTLLAYGMLAALMILSTLFFSTSFDFRLAYRVVLPLTGLGFLVFPFLGASQRPLAFALARGGYAVFEVLTWIQLSDVVFRTRLSAIKVFGATQFSLHAGILVGGLIGYRIGENILPPFAMISAAAVFVLIVILTYVLNDRDVAGAWGLLADASPQKAHYMATCDKIAEMHGLSPRETEIMIRLAKGRNAPHIGDELGISLGTVQTHIRNLYRKLEIHSRQDLLDMIEREQHGEPR